MASREKRPLAPSKTKQKANNAESILGSAQNNRKRNQPMHKQQQQQQQLAREILEVVAGGSEISPRLEASLPRKKVLRSLRRKQKLRNAKSNLINSKVTKKVPIKNIRRITVDVKKGVKLKRVKRLVEADRQVKKEEEEGREIVEEEEEVTPEGEEEDDTENETSTKKSNSRKKPTKGSVKTNEETESVASNERESGVFDNLVSTSTRNSPKTARKLKTEPLESPSKNSKTPKSLTTKRNASKERESNVKNAINLKTVGGNTTISPETKNLKKSPTTNSSVDLTIEEVVASMLSDTENEDCQVVAGKLTRSRKMLIDEKPLFTDVEIKKEILESEETRSNHEEDRPQTPQDSQTSIQLRNRSGNSFGQRSLRNGKLRQLSDSGISLDTEVTKKRRWLNMDESPTTMESGEMSVDNVSDVTIDAESSFSESSGNDNQSGGSLPSSKDETSPIKLDSPSDFDGVIDSSMELENNNNGERCDRIAGGEVGPILRSKTKAKSTEIEMKIEDPENDELRPLGGRGGNVGLAGQLEPRKSGSLDQLRKDNLSKITIDNKSPKSRRSSLNIDVKKTMSTFYTNERTDNSSKSHIDQMIENIKLTIAKSIESKIFGPENNLVRNKNFEVPKTEEIVAPLSAESQKIGILDDSLVEDNDKPNVSKSEVTASNSSDNSVPKVADTAKEIEKLVMGETELVETQNSESASSEPPKVEQQINEQQPRTSDNPESVETNEESNGTSEKSENLLQDKCANECDKVPEERLAEEEISNEHQREARKSMVTRKSLRIKSSSESILDLNTSATSTSTEDGEKAKSRAEDSPNEENPSADPKEPTSSSAETIESAINETTSSQMSTEGENTAESSFSDPRTQNLEEEKDTTDLNISNVLEDSETLESISKEVERLVGETPPTNTVDEDKLDKKEQESSENERNPVEGKATSVNKEKPEMQKLETPGSTCSGGKIDVSSPSTEQTVTNPENDAENPENGSTKLHKTTTSTESEAETLENAEKIPTKETSDCGQESRADPNKSKNSRNKEEEDQKLAAEENRRVLRARDKLKKAEAKQTSSRGTESVEVKLEPELHQERDELQDFSSGVEEKSRKETENSETGEVTIKLEEPEIPARTRRSREVKRRKEELTTVPQNTLKNKRSRKDVRKSEQQNKEETLLDDEVATINENNCSLVDKYDKVLGGKDNLRGFSEGGRGPVEKVQASADSNRSKSENDIEDVKGKSECSDRLSRQRAESDTLKENENVDGVSDLDSKIAKTPETPQKDSDEASTSGESSSSLTLGKIDESPEDKVKKEDILRLLGLEPLEKAAERLNHQKLAKKEQYTGTLKTVIRVQKDKDKKRSRSPLKMVLKQGRGDGDGDSPEFYTIQKEFGTSGLGDSSSGANRKFSTNHRHSCDEDTEEAPPKDRQSLVIPEKSSSFSIHPGRLCADVCCYCFGKFGSLDTPMHLAQMKSDERRQKILSIEKHLNKDSCLCDACYRHVDRRANTSPTNMQTKPQRQHRQLMVSKCLARDCREPARHHIKRRWLLKVKAVVQPQVDINWDLSQHTSMSFCVDHYSKIEPFLTCALCKRRLAKNHTHPIAASEITELNQRLYGQGIPVHLVAGTFVCKLCRYFTQLQLKYKYAENMNASHKTFCKTYRIRILHCHDIEVFEAEEDDATASTSKDKEKRNKKAKCSTSKNTSMSKSPDGLNNSASEKSTPEPIPKNSESGNSETEHENRGVTITPSEEAIGREVQLMDLESTVAKLKKRKALEQLVYTSEPLTTASESRSSSDVVEILAMDKEVTLTRLPKRPRVSNDITPVVQRLGANPSISVRTLFPGEEEMNLHANVEFANVREITPQGWEKCATMIQYDRDTKLLWQELQRPYGNQSSFLRHLILLEKYYRSGDLVLAPNASRNAINYSTSVQNRLISYEGPEKMDEPIMEPISSEYNSSRRLSGGYVMERDRLSLPGTSTSLLAVSTPKTTGTTSPTAKTSTSVTSVPVRLGSNASATLISPEEAARRRALKLTSGVSIIKKPPPSLQRLNLPSGSSSSNGGPSSANKPRKEPNKIPITSGGKVFQLSESEFRRLQNLKKQKQLLSEQQQKSPSPSAGSSSPNASTTISLKPAAVPSQYDKAQIAAQTQFQKHLRIQQEMLNRQSRGDFEPLICDVRSSSNENTPTQNLINTLNLPKSIQVTTKPSNPIPILPKIPKSLTVIPQTVSRPLDK